RCPGVGATLARIDRLDDPAFRRLQLAAEAGGGRGFLLRPFRASREPSWASVRLLITPLAALQRSVSEVRTRPADPLRFPLLKGERHEFEFRATRRLRLTVLS